MVGKLNMAKSAKPASPKFQSFLWEGAMYESYNYIANSDFLSSSGVGVSSQGAVLY